MKHFRVKVREEKAAFFEELLRYLDFLDYEQVEGFTEPRVYASLQFRQQETNGKGRAKGSQKNGGSDSKLTAGSTGDNLREVLSRIARLRENIHK